MKKLRRKRNSKRCIICNKLLVISTNHHLAKTRRSINSVTCCSKHSKMYQTILKEYGMKGTPIKYSKKIVRAIVRKL